MRLIDADELKVQLENAYEYTELGEVIDMLNNAPTVELFCSYLSDGEVRQPCVESPCKHERPQGEWLDIYSTHIAYECSNCHIQMPITDYFNFCSYCGADMRGKKNEQRFN